MAKMGEEIDEKIQTYYGEMGRSHFDPLALISYEEQAPAIENSDMRGSVFSIGRTSPLEGLIFRIGSAPHSQNAMGGDPEDPRNRDIGYSLFQKDPSAYLRFFEEADIPLEAVLHVSYGAQLPRPGVAGYNYFQGDVTGDPQDLKLYQGKVSLAITDRSTSKFLMGTEEELLRLLSYLAPSGKLILTDIGYNVYKEGETWGSYRGAFWLKGIETDEQPRIFYGDQEEYLMRFFLNLHVYMMAEPSKQEAVIAALGHPLETFHPMCRQAVIVCTRTQ
ncbi:MAG: hypothetical protein LBF76_00840 [Holosporales bacterium]|jgi:hypothetical protein|nr:hypothetical protein [Holosporales bacterium]